MRGGTGFYLGAAGTEFVRFDKPMAGHRLGIAAMAMGVPDVCPLEDTIPALLMILKHDRDVRMKDQIGRSQLAASVFGKGSMDGYLRVMYTPKEMRRNLERAETAKAEAENRAMMVKIKSLAKVYQIEEIRE